MSMFGSFVLADIPAEFAPLRRQVRALANRVKADLSSSVRARSWGGFDREFTRELGRAGLLGMTVPVEYGGQGQGAFARFIVVEELLAAGAPVAAHWIADRQSAPLLMSFGNEAQKRRFVPGICSGKLLFCIGMSEPNAGSDLANIRSRVEKTEAGWVLNGQKVWTTNAHLDDFMIALVRSSGGVEDRHRGLSQFIVDLKLPGVSIRPIRDVAGDTHFNEVFFDQVELPEDALLGEEGNGWAQCTAELAFERSGPERIYSSIVLLEAWVDHLRRVGRLDDATTALVGQLIAELAILRDMSIGCTALLAEGASPVVEASIIKDLGTAHEQSVPRLIGDDLASHPTEQVSAELTRTILYLLDVAPSFSLRGGTREILRGIIARGLGLR